AFPLSILLALGRRSDMPVIQALCVGFIELVRGVPLISILFMASVMLPLFLPAGVSIDKLLRAQIALILFAAAYLAEVVRGGLQAIPKEQYEAADALGLTYWQRTGTVILPQALRIAVPPLVNTIIGFFKDTSLVVIIGLFDHRRFESRGARIDRRPGDAEVGGEAAEIEIPESSFSKVAREAGSRFAVAFHERRAAVDLAVMAFAHHELRVSDAKVGMKRRPRCSLHAVVGPQNLLAVGEADLFEGL